MRQPQGSEMLRYVALWWGHKKCTKKCGGGASWKNINFEIGETWRTFVVVRWCVCVCVCVQESPGASVVYVLDDSRCWRLDSSRIHPASRPEREPDHWSPLNYVQPQLYRHWSLNSAFAVARSHSGAVRVTSRLRPWPVTDLPLSLPSLFIRPLSFPRRFHSLMLSLSFLFLIFTIFICL